MRDAGRLQLAHDLLVGGVLRKYARIHQDANLDARLEALDDRRRVPRVFHEPETDIDFRRLGVDQVQQRRAAILKRWIAERLAGVRGHT
jgi:hypothetical protein